VSHVGEGGTEETVLLTMPLPRGKEWHWLADCNVLVLSDQLDPAGRDRAISDLQATWRRRYLQSLPPPAA
jgi:hypothetical protein